MIGIICVLEEEAEKLRASMVDPETQRVGWLDFTTGMLMGQRTVVGMAHTGKVNAAMCAQTMILCYSPSLIINSGVAGSLSPQLNIGDIAVGIGAVEHDFDTTAAGDRPAFSTISTAIPSPVILTPRRPYSAPRKRRCRASKAGVGRPVYQRLCRQGPSRKPV